MYNILNSFNRQELFLKYPFLCNIIDRQKDRENERGLDGCIYFRSVVRMVAVKLYVMIQYIYIFNLVILFYNMEDFCNYLLLHCIVLLLKEQYLITVKCFCLPSCQNPE